MFQKGNQLATGGTRAGAGRKPLLTTPQAQVLEKGLGETLIGAVAKLRDYMLNDNFWSQRQADEGEHHRLDMAWKIASHYTPKAQEQPEQQNSQQLAGLAPQVIQILMQPVTDLVTKNDGASLKSLEIQSTLPEPIASKESTNGNHDSSTSVRPQDLLH